jgi:hypothetical protein
VRGRLSLAFEASQRLRVLRNFVVSKIEGYEAMKASVRCLARHACSFIEPPRKTVSRVNCKSQRGR